jgi:beta-glucosidase
MAQATFHFPVGFLWGSATSAHQVEGNNTNNNWWAWEQEPGRIVQRHKSGAACDWWGGRWREDFDRAAETGQNAHRMSVEWSRIQPTPDQWDENALDRYRDMARGLVERGLTPLITLHHYSDPLWFAEQGGWENDTAPERFERYVAKVVDALQEYVTLWITINEPNGVLAHGYILGDYPPGKRDIPSAIRAGNNLVRAHARAYHAIHRVQPHSRAGYAHLYTGFHPSKTWSPLDRFAAGMQFRLLNDVFPHALVDGVARWPLRRAQIPEARGTQDFLGINYYSIFDVAFDLFRPEEAFGRRSYPAGADLGDVGMYAAVPVGMLEALKWGLQFKIPLMITENGIDDSEDKLRPRYLIQHLHQVWRGVNFNWPVKGYFFWSLVDNFEWASGWTARFGLWELDTETQARRKRPSAELYEEICRENGISSELVARYAPEVFEGMFPN